MQLDPMEHWRQLTRHYADMSDGELIALAQDFQNLTEVARQALRDEMRKRNLSDPLSVASTPPGLPDMQQDSFDATNSERGGDRPGDLVWKEVLYRCSDSETASQISEVLRRAGIESWTDMPNEYAHIVDAGMQPRYRVLVSSDRLEEARAILARPIPADIIAESKAEELDYEPPVCPACGAPDPILDRVEPSTNFWKCDVCGGQWTETAEPAGEPL